MTTSMKPHLLLILLVLQLGRTREWTTPPPPTPPTDIDECAAMIDNCAPNAICTNTTGSFTCICDQGYSGNGTVCFGVDIDECTAMTDNCNLNAICTNTAGSFTCTCDQGYSGDGIFCFITLPSTPTDFSSASPNATTITLTWTKPPGEVVDQYLITYSYEEILCGFNNSIQVLVAGSSRAHNWTGVQENSRFTITIRARNAVGDSSPATTIRTTGIAAPSAPPTDLMVNATTPTSISLIWEHVSCEDRNAEITHYTGRYGPGFTISITVEGTPTPNFTATGLLPRNNYTFEVEAAHIDFATSLFLQGPSANVTGTTGAPTSVGFFLNGVLYPNNSVVALADIGQAVDIGGGNTSLFCLTDLLACCRGADTGTAGVGEWYLAGQAEPVTGVNVAESADSFARERAPSAVLLHRRNSATTPTGIYRCEIPDGSGLKTAYIGVDTGVPLIISLAYNRTLQPPTLTCTSAGGMVDSVTWKREGVEVGSEFTRMQTITDTLSATYQHSLSSEDIANFVGSFTCEVRDTAGNVDQRSLIIKGVTVISDQFTVGQSAVVTCSSDSGVVEKIEWQSEEGQVLANVTSVQQLDLVIDPVSDHMDGSEITCVVTRNTSSRANQTLTIDVNVPTNLLSVTVYTSGIPVAGLEFSMVCVISEDIAGLTNMSMATWLNAEGTPLTTGGDVIVVTSSNDTIAVAVLTFNPLRASHGEGGVRYRCVGKLKSPALDTVIEETGEMILRVQIPSPAVSLLVSPDPLYAGGAGDTTLNCSAMLDLTVLDTQMDIFYNFTWLDRDGVEVESGDRITIAQSSSTTRSSSLTLSPLSITDTNFTCTVRVSADQNTLSSSDLAVASTLVNVQVPAAPLVYIESTGTSIAGDTHTLTCSVTLQQPLRDTPTITWTDYNGIIDNGTAEDATISRPSISVVVLTFAPLRTSHGGEYRCVADMDIEEAGVFISNSSAVNITVQISPPSVVITGTPRNTKFFSGLPLTLTARAEFGLEVDTPLTVTGQWRAPNANPARAIVVGPDKVQAGPAVVVSSYSLTLDMTLDVGSYTLSLNISSHSFTTNITANATRNIESILVFPPQTVSATPELEGIPTAGGQPILVCNISREEELPSTTLLEVMWLDSANNPITDNSDYVILGTNITTDSTLVSSLAFTPLRASQGGVYRCVANMTIPGTVEDHSVSSSVPVSVYIPAATSVTFAPSREGPLYEGTTVDLECFVTLHDAVDTAVLTTFTFTRTPEDPAGVITASNVTGPGPNFTGVVRFSPLLPSDDLDQITCASSFQPLANCEFVQAVSNAPQQYQLQLESLPAPEVAVTSVPITPVGENISLTCTATVIPHLVTDPDLQWQGPEGSAAMATVGSGQVYTRELVIGSIRTSQAGQYSCVVTVNITGIPPVQARNSTEVRVQIAAPVLSVTISGEAVAGTVMSLVGVMASLDPLVDTTVSLDAAWTRQGQAEALNSSDSSVTTYQFSPVSTSDWGDYSYTVTVSPTDPTHVVASSSSVALRLIVQSYPRLVVSQTVLSGEQCEEDSTTLRGDVSANLHPNTHSDHTLSYTWRAPQDRLVTGNSGDLTARDGELVVRNVMENTGLYRLRVCITIADSDVVNHCSTTAIYSISNTVPGQVTDLRCFSPEDGGATLSIHWGPPSLNVENVNDYLVQVMQLTQQESGGEIELLPLTPPFEQNVPASLMAVNVTSGIAIEDFVLYQVSVTPRNPAGCGQSATIYCFTEVTVPTSPISIPAPSVTITASPVLPHLYTGLQLNLTCVIRLDLPLGYDVSVFSNWSKSGSALASNSRVTVGEGLAEVEPFVYHTSLMFNSLDKTRGDEGEYICTVTVSAPQSPLHTPVTAMARKLLLVETSVIQLRLLGVGNCDSWKASDPSAKDGDIVQNIISNVESRCGCAFTEDRLTQRGFQCFASSPDAVTYRVVLHSTREASVQDLTQDIEQWIQEGAPISVQFLLLAIDSSCDVAISSFSDAECRAGTGADEEQISTMALIGAVLGASVAVILVALALVAVLIVVWRKKHTILDIKDTEVKVPEGGVELKTLSPLYEDINTYETVLPPAPTSLPPAATSAPSLSGGASSEDYRLTACPAYVATISLGRSGAPGHASVAEGGEYDNVARVMPARRVMTEEEQQYEVVPGRKVQ